MTLLYIIKLTLTENCGAMQSPFEKHMSELQVARRGIGEAPSVIEHDTMASQKSKPKSKY